LPPVSAIGISDIEYELPGQPVELEQLAERGLLESPPERLRDFGFSRAYLSDRPADELALIAARRLMARSRIELGDIAAVFYSGAIPQSHAVGACGSGNLFNYPVAQLQYELGLERAAAIGVSQVGCMGLGTAVKMARDALIADPEAQHILCVSADVLPRSASHEILYNVISDGACALLVSRATKRNRILHYRQITKGYYWDCVGKKNEIVAAYFPTARNLMRDTLAAAGLAQDDVQWIIPHNVSRRSWEILLALLEVPPERLFAENIARIGHVIAADNWINLKDASARGLLHTGDKLLLFNFGFGANWACTLLEH
jgi:3-oxoacyl-[acyl-carrier-protein] synthase-3